MLYRNTPIKEEFETSQSLSVVLNSILNFSDFEILFYVLVEIYSLKILVAGAVEGVLYRNVM